MVCFVLFSTSRNNVVSTETYHTPCSTSNTSPLPAKKKSGIELKLEMSECGRHYVSEI